ncbi:MAG: ABC transporter substrate-binding protein [Burkholderiaceae bacterium]
MVSLIRTLHKSALTVATTLALGAATPAWAAKADDMLTVAFQRGILNLDYTQTTKREYIILSELTDDRLFNVDNQTLELIPAVGKSFKYVNDLTIDVELRDDVSFHDGSKLTADDVVYTYTYALDKSTRNKLTKRMARWLKKVEKTGSHSVRFSLNVPYPLAVRDMARRVPLRQNGIYHADGEYKKTAQTTRLNGTGPYRVVSFLPGKKVVLERFDDYYGAKGKPAIKTIVVRAIPDWGTQQAELLSGGIDWMYSVPTDMAENMGKTGKAEHLKGPSMRVGFLVLDAAGKTGAGAPLTKQKVRQAIIHAIDRQSIVDHLVKGSAEVIHAACHPVQFGCTDNVQKYPYDPSKAKQLISEAGYPDGFELDLWAYREKDVAEAIAADLNKAGIKLNLRYVKLNALNKARRAGQIPAYFGTWASGGTADVAALANVHWREGSDRNLSGDPKVTELMLGAEDTNDSDKRLALYDQGLKLIAEQAYWAPLYSFTLNYLINTELNFPVRKDGLPRLYEASWK